MQKLSEVLEDVKAETLRFLKKLEECQKRTERENDKQNGWEITTTKENGAVRRAALDLKNELTKITQSTNY